MLPKDLLDKVPTLNELLEHPRVREAARSWNDSTLVARARGALMELGSEISRRSESWSEASPRDLFDRVLHLLDRPDAPPSSELINGTGKMSSAAGWKQVPLAEEVVAYAAQQAGFFTCGDVPSTSADNCLKRLTKAESGLVASSYVTVHEAFLRSLSTQAGQGGAIIVGRPDVGSIEPGHRFLTLCEANQVSAVEVGAAQQATSNDYLEAIEQLKKQDANSQPWVYLGTALLEQLTTHDDKAALIEFISAMHKQKARLVVGLDDASPCDLPGALDCSFLTASKALELGADLVLLRGNGMVGGPAVGLLVGRRNEVDAIAHVLTEQHWHASEGDKVLVEATLTLFEQPERLPFRHPIASLLDTPIDNLRTRAERLALLINSSEAIASAEPIELTNRQVASGLRSSNSWGIKLTPSAEGGVTTFADLLRTTTPAVWGEIRGEELILDLRTILPSQDQQMVCAVSLGNNAEIAS